jgi:hypothetical protein
MSLVSKMTGLYDRVYPISDRFGVPSHCDFRYRDRVTSIETIVLPRPRVGSPSARDLTKWLDSGIEVNRDSVIVSGISRTFGGIEEGAICFIDGRAHTILWIDREQTVTYRIVAQPERMR